MLEYDTINPGEYWCTTTNGHVVKAKSVTSSDKRFDNSVFASVRALNFVFLVSSVTGRLYCAPLNRLFYFSKTPFEWARIYAEQRRKSWISEYCTGFRVVKCR